MTLASVGLAGAQSFQFTQYNFTQPRVNPAMFALTRYASASLDHRTQQTGGDFAIQSTFLSLTYPFLNSSTGMAWSGLNLSALNDQSGGIYTTNEVAAAYAINVRLSRRQSLSLGFRGLYQTRRINLDGFYTGSQFVADRGFDRSHSNGENLLEVSQSFSTFSTGIYWQQTDKKGRVLHHFGLSIFDINKPPDSFFNAGSALSSTFVLLGGFEAYHNGEFHIFPEALITNSYSNTVVNAGLRFQRTIPRSRNQPDDRVEVLTKIVVGRSGIVGFQLHQENFSFGVSYDFPIAGTNPANQGALEFGVAIRKLVATRSQKVAARRKKMADERRKTLTEKVPEKTTPKTRVVGSLQKKDTSSLAPSTVPLVVREEAAAQRDTVELSAKAGSLQQQPLQMEKVTLHFGFEFNSSELDDESEAFVDELAKTLEEDETLKVNIEGHTDNIGSDKFNLRLSLKRAEAVRQQLIKRGIPPGRLTATGKGMHEPLNENATEEDRSQNRRVVITLYHE